MFVLQEREIPEVVLNADYAAGIIAANDAMLTVFCNILSLSLCNFERYGCNLAREVLPLVKDLEVADSLRGFIRQEAGHTKVHMRYNELLYNDLPEIKKAIIDSNDFFVALMGEHCNDIKGQLHYAILIELHMANFARYFLKILDKRLSEFNPAIAYLFGYHFVEECEHRCVLFDAYKDIYGEAPNLNSDNIAAWHKLEKVLVDKMIFMMAYVLSAQALNNNQVVSAREVKHQVRDFLLADSGCFPAGYICKEYTDPNFHPYYSHLADNDWIAKWDNYFAPTILAKIM